MLKTDLLVFPFFPTIWKIEFDFFGGEILIMWEMYFLCGGYTGGSFGDLRAFRAVVRVMRLLGKKKA